MGMPDQITQPKLLLVEGKSAKYFFIALLQHMALEGIMVYDFGGVSELKGYLKAVCRISQFTRMVKSIGIVRDAEKDADAAFHSVCSALSGASLPVPKQPTTQTDQTPKVNVMILPDPQTPGMLETLCLRSVENDPVISCIDPYFECVAKQTGAPSNIDKAKAQAFLASRPKPGLLLGEAASKGYWDWESVAFDNLKQFMRSL